VKEKEVKEKPNLVANGRFQCLVALGRFQACWLMEGSKFGGLWKVLSLVVNGEVSCLVANGKFQCFLALGRFQAWWLLKGKGEGKTSFSPLFISPLTSFT